MAMLNNAIPHLALSQVCEKEHRYEKERPVPLFEKGGHKVRHNNNGGCERCHHAQPVIPVQFVGVRADYITEPAWARLGKQTCASAQLARLVLFVIALTEHHVDTTWHCEDARQF